jgi:hypothetical protein
MCVESSRPRLTSLCVQQARSGAEGPDAEARAEMARCVVVADALEKVLQEDTLAQISHSIAVQSDALCRASASRLAAERALGAAIGLARRRAEAAEARAARLMAEAESLIDSDFGRAMVLYMSKGKAREWAVRLRGEVDAARAKRAEVLCGLIQDSGDWEEADRPGDSSESVGAGPDEGVEDGLPNGPDLVALASAIRGPATEEAHQARAVEEAKARLGAAEEVLRAAVVDAEDAAKRLAALNPRLKAEVR